MICPITKLGDSLLEVPAKPVTEFGCDLAKIIENLFETMYSAHGIGLAAPQIGLSMRIAVIDVSLNENPSEKIVLVNPVVVSAGGNQSAQEGCLSIPGFYENVARPRTVTLHAQDAYGNWFERTWNDLLARAVLHETDHLDGRLFLSRLSGLKRMLIKRQVKKLISVGGW